MPVVSSPGHFAPRFAPKASKVPTVTPIDADFYSEALLSLSVQQWFYCRRKEMSMASLTYSQFCILRIIQCIVTAEVCDLNAANTDVGFCYSGRKRVARSICIVCGWPCLVVCSFWLWRSTEWPVMKVVDESRNESLAVTLYWMIKKYFIPVFYTNTFISDNCYNGKKILSSSVLGR